MQGMQYTVLALVCKAYPNDLPKPSNVVNSTSQAGKREKPKHICDIATISHNSILGHDMHRHVFILHARNQHQGNCPFPSPM